MTKAIHPDRPTVSLSSVTLYDLCIQDLVFSGVEIATHVYLKCSPFTSTAHLCTTKSIDHVRQAVLHMSSDTLPQLGHHLWNR